MRKSVAPHAVRLETLCSCSSPNSRLSFLPFVILADICSTFIVGMEKGPQRKGPALLSDRQLVSHQDW